MSLFGRLERRLQRFAVPNITVILIVGQVLVYGMTYFTPHAGQGGLLPQPNEHVLEKLTFVPHRFLAGEVWRVVTFLFVPPITNPIFALFFWYLFYLMGTALERSWSTVRYNLYLLIGFAATLAVAFARPNVPATNGFVAGSVFLAFAHFYPNFVISLFFVFPVRIKWLALVTWIGYFLAFALGDWASRLFVLASVANFLVFFGREIVTRMKGSHRRMSFQAARIRSEKNRVHRCALCGITSDKNRQMDFRYCTKCAGGPCYCSEHIRNHEHVTEPVK